MMMDILSERTINVFPDFLIKIIINLKSKKLYYKPSGYSFEFARNISRYFRNINYIYESDDVGEYIVNKYLENINRIKVNGSLKFEVIFEDEKKIYTSFSLENNYREFIKEDLFKNSAINVIYRITYFEDSRNLLKELDIVSEGKKYISLINDSSEGILKLIDLFEKGYIDYLSLTSREFDILCSYYDIVNVNPMISVKDLFANLNIEKIFLLDSSYFLIYPGYKICKLKKEINLLDKKALFDSAIVLSILKNMSYETTCSLVYRYLQ